jgi:hypothetical protein
LFLVVVRSADFEIKRVLLQKHCYDGKKYNPEYREDTAEGSTWNERGKQKEMSDIN